MLVDRTGTMIGLFAKRANVLKEWSRSNHQELSTYVNLLINVAGVLAVYVALCADRYFYR